MKKYFELSFTILTVRFLKNLNPNFRNLVKEFFSFFLLTSRINDPLIDKN